MRRYCNVFAGLLFGVVGVISGCHAEPLNIVVNASSEYSIVVPDNTTRNETNAAETLQVLLKQISRANIPIVKESSMKAGRNGIFVGKTQKIQAALAGLQDDGFLIRQDGKDILLGGKRGHSTEYAVCYFLEKYLGCRKYDRTPVTFPMMNSITIEKLQDEQINPAFNFRQAYYPMSNDAEYLSWHGLHKFEDLWGLWGHSFFKLVPPGQYFKTHPEYFSFTGGERRATQLCLSNQEVLNIVISKLKQLMADNPDAEYWSIGPNDEGGNCTCDLCKKADVEEGGPSGSLIRFVNKVAKVFPDKKITTLGYGYTAKAPTHTQPASNVYILVSSIDAFREGPIATISSAASFRQDLKGWSAITNNIFVWDYATQFTNYLSPFPDQHILQPNFQFFRQNKVQGIFEQGSGDTYSDMAELNSYLQAKLLWNPELNTEAIRADFCNGYYGKAAPFILEYLLKREKALLASGRHLDIYGNPVTDIRGYLSPENLDVYDRLLEKAETTVAGSVFEGRVRRIRLSLDYVVLQQSRHFGVEQYGFLENDNKEFYTVKSTWSQRVNRFVEAAKIAGVTELSEAGWSPDQYQTEWNKIFAAKWPANPALNTTVNLKYPFVEDYPAKGSRTLTDGMTGFNDFSYNWLCFYGNDMVAIVDLGKRLDIGTIKMNFLDDQRHWIFPPASVLVETSEDGNNFREFKKVQLPALSEKEVITINPITLASGKTIARYVRVTAVCPPQLPAWRSHPTKKPMIACDEIFVLP